jgi:uncharacterized protein (UPF0332 family)
MSLHPYVHTYRCFASRAFHSIFFEANALVFNCRGLPRRRRLSHMNMQEFI